MEMNRATLKALEMIKRMPNLPEKPHYPNGSFMFKEHPFVKPDADVLEYFKALGARMELNDNGEIEISRYIALLDAEGIKHNPIFWMYDARNQDVKVN